MIIIQEKLVSLDLFQEKFVCQLDKCKGACCEAGDFGAPLEDSEIETLKKVLPQIKPYLTEEGVEKIEAIGIHKYYKEDQQEGTTLLDNGACVFMTKDELGIRKCGIEQAYLDGAIEFKKPISCHLYPIRVERNEAKNFEALNYDRWEICSPACSNGEALNVKVYEFCKESIIRAYGEDFYAEMQKVDEEYVQVTQS